MVPRILGSFHFTDVWAHDFALLVTDHPMPSPVPRVLAPRDFRERLTWVSPRGSSESTRVGLPAPSR